MELFEEQYRTLLSQSTKTIFEKFLIQFFLFSFGYSSSQYKTIFRTKKKKTMNKYQLKYCIC